MRENAKLAQPVCAWVAHHAQSGPRLDAERTAIMQEQAAKIRAEPAEYRMAIDTQRCLPGRESTLPSASTTSIDSRISAADPYRAEPKNSAPWKRPPPPWLPHPKRCRKREGADHGQPALREWLSEVAPASTVTVMLTGSMAQYGQVVTDRQAQPVRRQHTRRYNLAPHLAEPPPAPAR